jgi:hypothetical protein
VSRHRRCAQGHPLGGYGRPCGLCKRDQALALVVAAERSLSVGQVTAAFDAVATNPQRLRSLAAALAADPRALGVGAPPLVGRLVGELVARGSLTFTVPACVRCRRDDRPLFRSSQGGVCAHCRSRQLAAACAHCGVTKPVAGRSDAGEPICERCRRRDRGRRRCGVCAKIASIAVRGTQGRPDVCVNCYRLPEAVCVRCRRHRPCSFADGLEPLCKACTPRRTAPCARCGNDRPPTARWPEGPLCEPCYRAALHRRGVCAGCGQTRRLVDPPGREATRCGDCAGGGVPGGHVCASCGVEDRLFERGRCARCALARRAHELLADEGGVVPAVLIPLTEAIAAARQPYSALNWLRNGAGAAVLAEVAAGRLALTHEALDAHPRPRAADYLRRMLTAHGVLPERDEDLLRAERWVADLLARIQRPADQQLVRTYATWRVLRRLRRRAAHNPRPRTPTHHAKLQLRAAVGLLDWLAEHGLVLADTGQADIDAWLAAGPTAYQSRDFLVWAAQHGHSRHLSVPAPPRRSGVALADQARWELVARLLHDDTLELTDRVAGSLVLLYAQQLSRITALTTAHVTRGEDTTSIRFGAHDVNVPEPLARLLGALIDTPRSHLGVGAPATSRWLFPGHHPGRPLSPAHLGVRLRRLGIPTMAARRAALIHLAAQLPAAVLADLLNLSAGTAVRWVNTAGGDWSRYAAALAQDRHHNRHE